MEMPWQKWDKPLEPSLKAMFPLAPSTTIAALQAAMLVCSQNKDTLSVGNLAIEGLNNV